MGQHRWERHAYQEALLQSNAKKLQSQEIPITPNPNHHSSLFRPLIQPLKPS